MRDAVAPGGHDPWAVGAAVRVAPGVAAWEGEGVPLGCGVSWTEALAVGTELLATKVAADEEAVPPKKGKRPNTSLITRRSTRTTTATPATVITGKLGNSLMAGAPAAEQTLLSRRSFSLPTDSIHQEAIKEAMRYLLTNFRTAIRLDEVLRLTRMGKTAFSLQFKKYSGKTFSEAVSQLRLHSACRELVETDRPILAIALSCGFAEISFFNRAFRRMFRCSPSEYRARERRRQKRPA